MAAEPLQPALVGDNIIIARVIFVLKSLIQIGHAQRVLSTAKILQHASVACCSTRQSGRTRAT